MTVEPGPDVSPTASVERVVTTAHEGDTLEFTRVCWECGRKETRELTVDAVHVDPGDETVRERRAFVEAVNAELERIGSIGALRDALAEVERIRRLRSSDPDE